MYSLFISPRHKKYVFLSARLSDIILCLTFVYFVKFNELETTGEIPALQIIQFFFHKCSRYHHNKKEELNNIV